MHIAQARYWKENSGYTAVKLHNQKSSKPGKVDIELAKPKNARWKRKIPKVATITVAVYLKENWQGSKHAWNNKTLIDLLS